jgi:exopolysaccharide production protein ExoY
VFGFSLSARSGGAFEESDVDVIDRPAPAFVANIELTTLTPARLQMELPRLLREWKQPDTEALVNPLATRCLDIVVASVALLFFAPLMAFIALAIKFVSPGPAMFCQQRLGHRGRTFKCLKFRTMDIGAEARLAELLACDPFARAEWHSMHKLRNDPRVSAFGSMLRRTSLDELPQLFNVLLGDMSIVGPRPIVREETYHYGRYIGAYYAVKPGITGLWQISGRNDTSYRRRVACDVRYVRTKSAFQDLAIIMMTFPVVIFGRGAY